MKKEAALPEHTISKYSPTSLAIVATEKDGANNQLVFKQIQNDVEIGKPLTTSCLRARKTNKIDFCPVTHED